MSLGSLFKMCIVCISTVTVASLLAPTTPVAQNNVNEYTVTTTACPKSKVNKVENNRICLKNGTVYRWAIKKTTAVIPTPTTTPTPTQNKTELPTLSKKYFSNPCELDLSTPEQWKDLEKFYTNKHCVGPLRIPSTKESLDMPKTFLNKNEINLSECKISQNINKLNTLAFQTDTNRLKYFNNTKHPSHNTVYHLVGIYSNEMQKPNTNPENDYKEYLNFISSYTEAASDITSSIKFKIHNEYIYFPENITKYNLVHNRKQSDAELFNNDFTKYIDSKIDFSGSNVILIVFPPGNKLITEQVGLGMMPIKEQPLVGSIMPHWKSYANNVFAMPMWWMHELNHVAVGFDDNNSQENNAPMSWGLISKISAYDLFVWQKWIVGFISDNQVICLNNKVSSTILVSPSTIKSNKVKLLLIPVSNTKIIAIESQRSEGINYKMPEISEGALVYIIDTSLTSSHDGIRLVLPQNKTMINNNSNATLKLNEFAIYENYKISVIESGDFGDVILVTRV